MSELLISPWAGAVQVFLAVALGVVCLALLWEGIRRLRREKVVSRQLEQLSRMGDVLEADSKHAPLFRMDDDEESRGLAALFRYLPRRQDLARLLERADSSWGVGTFFLLTAGLGAASGLGASVVFSGTIAPMVVAASGAALPYLHLRRRRKRRAEAFEEHFPESIELLARSLRAGHALLTGFEVVAQEAPPPVNKEFRQVYEQQRFGLPLQESLLGLADRVASVDVRMFVTSIMIQRESGGNLAEILDNLAGLMRERFKFRRQLRVYTAQGRMTGYVLAFLPVALGLIVFSLNREFMIVLVEEPSGRMMLLAAAVMQVAGFLWIRKIVNVEF